MGVYYAWAEPNKKEWFELKRENIKWPVTLSPIVVFELITRGRWECATIYNDAADYPWSMSGAREWKCISDEAELILEEVWDEETPR